MSVISNTKKLGNVLYVSVLNFLVSLIINFIVFYVKKKKKSDRIDFKFKKKKQKPDLWRNIEPEVAIRKDFGESNSICEVSTLRERGREEEEAQVMTIFIKYHMRVSELEKY